MNKRSFFSLVTIILFACSITAPTATVVPVSSTVDSVQPTTQISTLVRDMVTATLLPECARYKLTPEQCANQGQRNYILKSCEVLNSQESNCECSAPAVLTSYDFLFTEKGLVRVKINGDPLDPDLEKLTKISANVYTYPYTLYSLSKQSTITFTKSGFTRIVLITTPTTSCEVNEVWEPIK